MALSSRASSRLARIGTISPTKRRASRAVSALRWDFSVKPSCASRLI